MSPEGFASPAWSRASSWRRARSRRLPIPPVPISRQTASGTRRFPKSVPLNPNSAAYVGEFLRQYGTYYNDVGINTAAYSTPVYAADAQARTVPVTQWSCQGYLDAGLNQQWSAVPIPPDAQPADGTDAEMTIYQPSSDSLWEFWQARQVHGQWQACWGGMMPEVSKNPGIWAPRYGVAATGLPFAPGQVTLQELNSGVIRHVIGIALVDAEKDLPSSPGRQIVPTVITRTTLPIAFPKGSAFASIPASMSMPSISIPSRKSSPRRPRLMDLWSGTRAGSNLPAL